MKKVAIISDIHGNIEALNAVLKHIEEQSCSEILCCGDLVGYGPRPNEVIQVIQALNIPTIMGNYDEAVGFLLPACGCHIDNKRAKALSNNSLRWSIAHTTEKNRAILRDLPEEIEVTVESKSIYMTHATKDSITEYVYEGDDERLNEIAKSVDQDIYIYGHTHLPFIREINGKIIINAGSVGRPKDGDNRAAYVIITVEDLKISCSIQKVEYDIEKVIKEIEADELDDYFGVFLKNGGDSATICKLEYNGIKKVCEENTTRKE